MNWKCDYCRNFGSQIYGELRIFFQHFNFSLMSIILHYFHLYLSPSYPWFDIFSFAPLFLCAFKLILFLFFHFIILLNTIFIMWFNQSFLSSFIQSFPFNFCLCLNYCSACFLRHIFFSCKHWCKPCAWSEVEIAPTFFIPLFELSLEASFELNTM